MMQLNFSTKLLLVALLFGFWACNPDKGSEQTALTNDSLQRPEKKITDPAWDETKDKGQKGLVGIFEVPEMLALCRLDSAYMKDVSAAVLKDFALLENDLRELGAEVDRSQGIIYYNNNPEILSRVFLLLKNMPQKKPRHSQIVVLEASKMLIYNYYGPFENTFKAYEEIKKYCELKHLVQTGQLREYYPLAQSNESDRNKLLTRIMVPVARERNPQRPNHKRLC